MQAQTILAIVFLSITPALSAPIVTYVDQDTFYSRSQVRSGIGQGGLTAEIYGAPQAGVSAEEIAEHLQMPPSFRRREIVAVSPNDPRTEGTRLVILFNAGVPSADRVCSDPASIEAQAQDGPLQAYAAFCHGDTWFSRGMVRDASVSGIDDPHFTRSMQSLFRAMTPRRNPYLRDNNRGGFGN